MFMYFFTSFGQALFTCDRSMALAALRRGDRVRVFYDLADRSVDFNDPNDVDWLVL